jgi:hypothetical protein
MAPGILSAVRPLAFKVLFILTVSGGVVGVIEFVRSIRRHR